MASLINSEKLLKLGLILKKILLSAKDIESADQNQKCVKIFQILDMLVQMQSLNVAIRAELIELLIAIRNDFSHKIIEQIKNRADNIILLDRRRGSPDRRKLHTYIADDRRNGIADRRKRLKAESRSLDHDEINLAFTNH